MGISAPHFPAAAPDAAVKEELLYLFYELQNKALR